MLQINFVEIWPDINFKLSISIVQKTIIPNDNDKDNISYSNNNNLITTVSVIITTMLIITVLAVTL